MSSSVRTAPLASSRVHSALLRTRPELRSRPEPRELLRVCYSVPVMNVVVI
jgi:hypothetical protein